MKMKNAKSFDLSSQCKYEFDQLGEEDWVSLISACNAKSLKAKDIILLRLYMTFMGLEMAEETDDPAFLDLCH